uniref:Uncharacterized protein n=1 Tax=Panagrolaimus sp. JU765 TaxID=591449 RepID=A0AC34RHN4_9BILA
MAYLFNIAYGVGKAGCDRLAADMAVDLAPSNVASISLWPGPVKTEIVQQVVLQSQASTAATKSIFEKGETTEFSGKCIVELFKDKNLLNETGKILTTAELAVKYGIKDEGGSQPIELPERFEKYLKVVNELRNWKDAKLNAKI